MLANKKVFIFQLITFLIIYYAAFSSIVKVNSLLGDGLVYYKGNELSLFDLALSFILATAFMIASVRLLKNSKHKPIFFSVLFSFVILFTGISALSIWIPGFLAVLLMFFLTMLWLINKSAFLNNIVVGISILGVSLNLSYLVGEKTAIIFAVALSIYDYIAVYKTKHMVYLAKEMIKSKGIFGFVFPQKLNYFKDKVSVSNSGENKMFIMGGGDVAIPLIFSCSVFINNYFHGLLVALFSIAGLLFSFFIFSFQKERVPMPALPPIVLFSLIGYIIFFAI